MKGMTAVANELTMQNVTFLLEDGKAEEPPFINSIEFNLKQRHQAKELWLPNLAHNDFKTIFVASDFGGDHQESEFRTYSFVFAGYEFLGPVLNQFKRIRYRHGLIEPYREINFKEFRYGPIGRCVPDWLQASNCITGLLFTLVVSKDCKTLFGVDDAKVPKQLAKMMEDLGFGSWSPDDTEKVLRIVHVIGYFLGLLSRPGQNVIWMCDNDSIAANADRVEQLRKLFALRLSQYGHGQYGEVALAFPFEKTEESFHLSEFLSVVDLSAGSIAELLTRRIGNFETENSL
ncbi:hypothetical protein Poly51_35020 [Rubripirellula tenax]|uniref:Uncharacterized protein n=1 Tax=Rubripirellula tenax TaxID=2528015 RepID=A0A5C6EYQ4_9BACT|nr:hypothetical protein [Rubripirellula tenax]TWU54783.1 hypothetical protein Poly51_35020 [Rubripirellula tenax]